VVGKKGGRAEYTENENKCSSKILTLALDLATSGALEAGLKV
jgi:hypothetical protein